MRLPVQVKHRQIVFAAKLASHRLAVYFINQPGNR